MVTEHEVANSKIKEKKNRKGGFAPQNKNLKYPYGSAFPEKKTDFDKESCRFFS